MQPGAFFYLCIRASGALTMTSDLGRLNVGMHIVPLVPVARAVIKVRVSDTFLKSGSENIL
jgi:hypothetical protein